MKLTMHIAGIPHRKPDLSVLKVGDLVSFVPEPTNAYDPNAVKILHSGVHLGYVPKDLCLTVLGARISEATIVKLDPSTKWREVIVETKETSDATH